MSTDEPDPERESPEPEPEPEPPETMPGDEPGVTAPEPDTLPAGCDCAGPRRRVGLASTRSPSSLQE